MNIKKGDIVGRISYGKDILFSVKKIIKNNRNQDIAILKGITVRIEADSPIEDLILIDRQEVKRSIEIFENDLKNRVQRKHRLGRHLVNRINENNYTGKILHLDGDALL